MAASKKGQVLELEKFETNTTSFYILGKTPMIIRRMSQKAAQELLYPSGRKTAAARAKSMKHIPHEEFAESPYTNTDPKAQTYIEQMGSCFKMAMCGAALDVAGASKAQTKRLLIVNDHRVPIWGEPKVHMSITRSADMNKTPDVRTRCIVENWATEIKVTYSSPMNLKNVAQLLSIAGTTQGIGDWRPEKGSGNFGQFEVVAATDKRYKEATKFGRKLQLEAMDRMECYDDETEELWNWFYDEVKNRGIEISPESNLKVIYGGKA